MTNKTKLLIGLPLLAVAILFLILTICVKDYSEALTYPFIFFVFSASFVFVEGSTRGKLNWLLLSVIIFALINWFLVLYMEFTGIKNFTRFMSVVFGLAFYPLFTYGSLSVSHLWSNLSEVLKKRTVVKALVSFIVSYFLFISFFALLFGSIYLLDGPMSFSANRSLSLFDFFYFSAVTATTLGYGDISPINELAKLLTIIEVFISIVIVALYFGIVINKIQEKPVVEENKTKSKEE